MGLYAIRAFRGSWKSPTHQLLQSTMMPFRHDILPITRLSVRCRACSGGAKVTIPLRSSTSPEEDIMSTNLFTRKTRSAIVTVASLAILATGTTAAHADEATATVDTSTIVFGSIDAKATVRTVNAAGVTVNGKPVVAYVHSNPKHWNPAKAKKVRFAKNYWAGVRSGKPFRLRKGQKFPDTYVGMAADMTTHNVALTNRVKHAWQLFDRSSTGVVRNRGFWTGTRWVGDCANPKPTSPPTTTIDNVVVVKQRGSLSVKVMGSISLWAITSGKVRVDCGSGNWAEAMYSAKAEATIDGWVSIKASTRLEAITKGAEALKAKYRQSIEADAALRGDAKIELEGSATASCSSNQPPSTEAPTVDVTPVACVNPGTTRDVTITVSNPNGETDTAKVTYRGQVYTKPVAAHGQVTFTFANQAAGTYSGTALLVTANKSKPFTVTVEECPPPADNPPSLEGQVPVHIFVGEDPMAMDFDAFDADGDPITFDYHVDQTYVAVTLVERSVVNGKQRLTIWVRPKDNVPAGESRFASVWVQAQAGGKLSNKVEGSIEVTNQGTGW